MFFCLAIKRILLIFLFSFGLNLFSSTNIALGKESQKPYKIKLINYKKKDKDILSQVLFGFGLGTKGSPFNLYGKNGWLNYNKKANPMLENFAALSPGTEVVLQIPYAIAGSKRANKEQYEPPEITDETKKNSGHRTHGSPHVKDLPLIEKYFESAHSFTEAKITLGLGTENLQGRVSESKNGFDNKLMLLTLGASFMYWKAEVLHAPSWQLEGDLSLSKPYFRVADDIFFIPLQWNMAANIRKYDPVDPRVAGDTPLGSFFDWAPVLGINAETTYFSVPDKNSNDSILWKSTSFWGNAALDMMLLHLFLKITPQVGFLFFDSTESKNNTTAQFAFDSGTRFGLNVEMGFGSKIIGCKFLRQKMYKGDVLDKDSSLIFGGWKF